MSSEPYSQIIAALQLVGVTAWRSQSGIVRLGKRYIHMAPTGTPDLVGYTRTGRFVGIEVKSASGRLSKHQAQWLQDARRATCVVGMAQDPSEAVKLVLEAQGGVAEG